MDWGLGHATRCIPIIRELLLQGCEPWLAGTGIQKEILQSDFPELSFLELEGYNVHYSSSGKLQGLGIMLQAPHIWNKIHKEQKWLQAVHKKYHFQGLISDNRFGLYHPDIRTVFITHQLSIRTGMGGWADRLVHKWNYRFINRFNECWIPDWKGAHNLSGELSHPALIPPHAKYIGPLSRLEPNEPSEKIQLLIILSGPENQRSMLESMLLGQLAELPHSFLMVRGLPSSSPLPRLAKGKIVNNMASKELSKAIAGAELVLCRSGYSSIMDLVKLRKKMILIPTPGQAEQQYLFHLLQDKNMALGSTQENLNLRNIMEKARDFSYQFPVTSPDNLKEIVSNWLSALPH